MRREEAFVCSALVTFLRGPSVASGTDGDDPPDIYLTLGGSRVSVEVTRLSQFTIEPEGTLGNRATQDSFGIRLIEDLNTKLGPLLPKNVSLLIGGHIPVPNASRCRQEVTEWVTQVAASPNPGTKDERNIDGSSVSVSVIPEQPSGKKIVGFVVNKHSSADILLNARFVLEERIRTKSRLCEGLARLGPIWLALFNDYWLADADTCAAAYRQLKISHCFERLFLISDNGAVCELVVEA
jgi:hypothetical protein